MKKVVWLFCVSWAVFCLAMVGAQTLQPFVLRSLAIDPNTAQEQGGGIYNQGALTAIRGYLPTDGKAVFIDGKNSLEHLSVLYWVYPVELVRSRYGTDLTLALQHPEQSTIIFVGHRDVYYSALPALQPGFTATVITTLGDDVFAVIKRS